MTQRKVYSKIVIPTPDAVLCRGPNIFAQQPGRNDKKGKILVAIPRSMYQLIRRREFGRVIGYTPRLKEAFERNRESLLDMIITRELHYGAHESIGSSVDVMLINDEGQEDGEMDLVHLVKNARKILRDKGLRGKIIAQAVLKDALSELQMNRKDGIEYEVPKYLGIGPNICKKFVVDVDNIADDRRFKEFMRAMEFDERVIEDEDEEEYAGYNPPEQFRQKEPQKEKIHYIPAEAFKELMGKNPMPNQFIVLTEYAGDDDSAPRQRAFRLRYGTRRMYEVDLDNKTEEISHIWQPAFSLDIRQKLALDLLLDPNVKIVYLIGGKQTGKTSIAMAAFEAYVFGRGAKYDRKTSIEQHINLIKSGLEKKVLGQQELIDAYDSYIKTFRDQEIGIMPFEEMLKSEIEREEKYRERVPSKSEFTARQLEDSVRIPRKAPFVLLSPTRSEGMTFTGLTIRDETQREFPHVMREFFDRRGPGARYAILGDVYSQITTPGLDKFWNGLLLSVYKNIGLPHVGGVELTKCWSAVDDIPDEIT